MDRSGLRQQPQRYDHVTKQESPSASIAALRRRASENQSQLNRHPGHLGHQGRSISALPPPPSLLKSNVSVAMDANRATNGSVSTSSFTSTVEDDVLDVQAQDLLAHPFEMRHGRRYLRDVPYPLPCDLTETHRQNLRTMLGLTVFDGATCAYKDSTRIPKRVLEIGCGCGYWSSACHEYFTSLGHPDVSFTGIDLAPLAPDFAKQGMNWRFVQHDIRRIPWPFSNGEFDLIMVKDMSLAIQIGITTQRFVDETIRILAEGGTLELWESDHVLRCLQPPPLQTNGSSPQEEDEVARATKTFLISTATTFSPAQDKYIADSNSWIRDALDKLRLPPTPCSRIAQILYQEPDSLCDVSWRRVAIPLGQLRWEKDQKEQQQKRKKEHRLKPSSKRQNGRTKRGDALLTPDQAALRYTALLTVLQKIEGLEPLLKDVSGKNAEEWSRWLASMMSILLDQDGGCGSGEVLEVGAWWATKRTKA